MALNLGAGDEVIVPANTFFATPEAVSLSGATPVFVDCEKDYFNIDPDLIEAAITPHTKVIVAVNLFGQAARLDKIKVIADKHGIILIEDCAQSHLATFNDQFTGNYGLAGCFSFYPGKNLGAYGEAGAVLTNDEALYKKLMALRDHGSSVKYFHDFIGHNYRMEGLQGAILNVKLNHLDEWTEKRRHNAVLYTRVLSGIPQIIVPKEMPGAKHVYHLYVIRAEQRDELIKYLADNEVFTGIHYPVPCHLQKAYASLAYQIGSLPNSEKFAGEILSLPMYPELTLEQISFVAEKIKEFYQK
jgi:dTDP-4-amino-4,6-dideoxygalactose transaminase